MWHNVTKSSSSAQQNTLFPDISNTYWFASISKCLDWITTDQNYFDKNDGNLLWDKIVKALNWTLAIFDMKSTIFCLKYLFVESCIEIGDYLTQSVHKEGQDSIASMYSRYYIDLH